MQHTLRFLALTATCRDLQTILKANVGHIFWSLGNRDLYAFDLALIAVRATKIVCDSLQNDRLPSLAQLYPIQRLSGTALLPTTEEMRQIFDLQHFGSCVERHYFLRRLWRERVYRNIFRLMICGAYLARPYHQPFFNSPGDPRRPRGLRRDGLSAGKSAHPSPKTVQFLSQFPIYNATYNSNGTAPTSPKPSQCLRDEAAFVTSPRRRNSSFYGFNLVVCALAFRHDEESQFEEVVMQHMPPGFAEDKVD
ncbi:hypothetical protein B0T16DRAFT_518399 [Cercophora newfieldiana]|uniref:Uncharacterized protein n=1 Tax=Cercophora newfieldiana TaxID=92897 RepID=A0AA40CHY8_9PEZI|nr:hypothetical protein B0T16DRAFT_518399 [Cercophora newfieldiana]